jgi:hypothetical protein
MFAKFSGQSKATDRKNHKNTPNPIHIAMRNNTRLSVQSKKTFKFGGCYQSVFVSGEKE